MSTQRKVLRNTKIPYLPPLFLLLYTYMRFFPRNIYLCGRYVKKECNSSKYFNPLWYGCLPVVKLFLLCHIHCTMGSNSKWRCILIQAGMYPQGRPLRSGCTKILRYLNPIPTRGDSSRHWCGRTYIPPMVSSLQVYGVYESHFHSIERKHLLHDFSKLYCLFSNKAQLKSIWKYIKQK
jgi:hypothetical protein